MWTVTRRPDAKVLARCGGVILLLSTQGSPAWRSTPSPPPGTRSCYRSTITVDRKQNRYVFEGAY
jgi:hypothetical protein